MGHFDTVISNNIVRKKFFSHKMIIKGVNTAGQALRTAPI